MNIVVRRAEREDVPALFGLIMALAEFEQLAPPSHDAQERMRQHGWPIDGAPKFHAWLAEIEEEGSTVAVGYAITFYTYSTFLTKPTLYMEDLFILPNYRRFGAGSALLKRLAEEALAQDCGRMEWVVLDWNTGAQQFYQRIGAGHLTEWQYYRLDRVGIEGLAVD